MQSNIIVRLFASFSELETAIQGARIALEEKGPVPQHVQERLHSYDSIIDKQRKLAHSLCSSLDKGDWDEVNRQVNLINGLSSMIRDDARAILAALAPNGQNKGFTESNLC